MKNTIKIALFTFSLTLTANVAFGQQPAWIWWMNQADQQMKDKNYTEAVKSYTECITKNKDADGCYSGRGKAYAALGKKNEAKADFEKAFKLNPQNKDAANALGNSGSKPQSNSGSSGDKPAQNPQKNPDDKADPKAQKIEIADKSVTSISQIKDVKPTDDYYEALTNLTERYGVITLYQDSTFRPEKPLTRLQFAISLNYSIDVMLQVMSANDINDIYILFNAGGYPANNKITSMKEVKDIPPDFVEFGVLQRVYEEYEINLGDSDGYFRPNKEMSEKEYFDALEGIFGIEHNAQASPTKIITRGRFVNDLAFILDHKNEELGNAATQSSNEKKTETIKNLPSKGKAKITSYLKSYSPDNTCLDLKTASSEIREVSVNGGVWGDYKIKNGDIGDIVFESINTCSKGNLVLLRIGTALVTMNEVGIKRLK